MDSERKKKNETQIFQISHVYCRRVKKVISKVITQVGHRYFLLPESFSWSHKIIYVIITNAVTS